MRHGNAFRKFNRSVAHRRALFRNLATSLILKESFETTVAKAKDLRRVVEKIVTLGREDTLARRRQAYGYLFSKEAVHKLFTDIGPRFKGREGGYTRIVRTRVRPGDAAELAQIEFVAAEAKKAPKKKAAPKKSKDKESTTETTASA